MAKERTYIVANDFNNDLASAKFHAEIEAGSFTVNFIGLKVFVEGGSKKVTAMFDADLDPADETALDALVAAHNSFDLEDAKAIKRAAIDYRTRELIANGFSHNSKSFSLSSHAQRNLRAYDANKATLSYPYEISTLEDDGYSVTDVLEMQDILDTAFTGVESPLSSGRTLKESVNAATTQAELDAVVDNR